MKMKRTIEQWRNCIPEYMAFDMSDAAKMYAIDDAKQDILQLYKLAERVANLNKDAVEIGAGMLNSLVDEARRIIDWKE